MKLSEEIAFHNNSGDFGRSLDGLYEKAKELEDKIEYHNELARIMSAVSVKQMFDDYSLFVEIVASWVK